MSNSEVLDSDTDNQKEDEIKPSKVLGLKQWLFLTTFLIVYYILCLIPYEYFEKILDTSILPDKYWFNAIPTFIFVTAAFIFVYAKAFEMIKTVDNPPYKDFYYKELDIKQMRKEIDYDYSEGILPHAGDLDQKVVEDVLAMNKKNK